MAADPIPRTVMHWRYRRILLRATNIFRFFAASRFTATNMMVWLTFFSVTVVSCPGDTVIVHHKLLVFFQNRSLAHRISTPQSYILSSANGITVGSSRP